jgi:hypothetical protein
MTKNKKNTVKASKTQTKSTKATKAPKAQTKGTKGTQNAKTGSLKVAAQKNGIRVTRLVPVGTKALPVRVNATAVSGTYQGKDKAGVEYQITRFAGGRILDHSTGEYQPNEKRKTLSTRFEVYRMNKNGSLTWLETVKGFNKALVKYGLTD